MRSVVRVEVEVMTSDLCVPGELIMLGGVVVLTNQMQHTFMAVSSMQHAKAQCSLWTLSSMFMLSILATCDEMRTCPDLIQHAVLSQVHAGRLV